MNSTLACDWACARRQLQHSRGRSSWVPRKRASNSDGAAGSRSGGQDNLQSRARPYRSVRIEFEGRLKIRGCRMAGLHKREEDEPQTTASEQQRQPCSTRSGQARHDGERDAERGDALRKTIWSNQRGCTDGLRVVSVCSGAQRATTDGGNANVGAKSG